ncbi:Putative PotA-like ABC transporter ATP-binding protein [Candidatus Trichorickettsia mobilis]|uniref:Spermidine/putrescine import ATP-binding protein PotA n=1 Tax=Candidatus Trichorickettsia mobilis TaxID=1346319 RepID=A0ABZ0UV22_9RICK|nr:spermidine/putrescine ABC transporter ATP-binding protein PotA [Candidatus Trichorickettsia mobilis]WPY00927.1 Putative PotA-like ABC transporter ATP-binding protein [Candidatus Trichorickettsia mobilis]
MNAQTPVIELINVSKSYYNTSIIKNLTLAIYAGEFISILGPSGSGKTTILRLIAGFENADSGDIIIDGQNVNKVPPNRRKVNTVFQNYALFPHMSVYENIAFGLTMEGKSKDFIQTSVDQVCKIVRLDGLSERRPSQLSGGEQQRVAIARAIIKQPKVLLFDESLSALDYKLRQEMQFELKQIHKKLGITFVFVTHDQEEALSMADRVVVMSKGQIEQIGNPIEVYESPKNLFVAQFVGEINVFDGLVMEVDGDNLKVIIEGIINYTLPNVHNFKTGDNIKILLRPEDLRIETLAETSDTSNKIIGVVESTIYKGATLDSLIILANGKKIKASEFFDEDAENFEYTSRQKVVVSWVANWEVILADD